MTAAAAGGRTAGHRSDRAVSHKVTGSVGRDSTTDAFAPAHEAGHDRNVEHFPIQPRTAAGPGRSQAATQLQHSNSEGEIQLRNPREKSDGKPDLSCFNNRRVGLANFENT